MHRLMMVSWVSLAPAAPPAAPQASVAPMQTIAQSLGANGNNSEIDQIIAAKAPAVVAAGQAVKQAKAQMQAAAASNDPSAIQKYGQLLQQATGNLDAMLKNLDPRQADTIRKTVGY